MRLGYSGLTPTTLEEFDAVAAKMDMHKLGTINVHSHGMDETWTEEYCRRYGERAKELGIVIGEVAHFVNLIPPDEGLKQQRFDRLCEVIKLADAMGARCVVSILGTKDPSDHIFAPHPYLYTQACKNEVREYVLRLLEKSNPTRTKFVLESWNNSFFYRFEEIAEFFSSVDHPMYGIHLDMMNFMNQFNYWDSTTVITQVIDHFGDDIISCHMQDISWDYEKMFLHLNEAMIGDGVMDYDTYLKKLSALSQDVPCLCEHLSPEEKYFENIARLHKIAKKNGLSFKGRGD